METKKWAIFTQIYVLNEIWVKSPIFFVFRENWLKFAVSIETNKKRRKWEQAISW